MWTMNWRYLNFIYLWSKLITFAHSTNWNVLMSWKMSLSRRTFNLIFISYVKRCHYGSRDLIRCLMNNSLVVLLFLGNHFTLSLQQFIELFFRRSIPMLMPNMWTRIYCWVPFVYISLHFRRVQGKFIEKDSVSIPFPNNCACYDDLGRIYNLKTLQNVDETASFAKSYPRHI